MFLSSYQIQFWLKKEDFTKKRQDHTSGKILFHIKFLIRLFRKSVVYFPGVALIAAGAAFFWSLHGLDQTTPPLRDCLWHRHGKLALQALMRQENGDRVQMVVPTNLNSHPLVLMHMQCSKQAQRCSSGFKVTSPNFRLPLHCSPLRTGQEQIQNRKLLFQQSQEQLWHTDWQLDSGSVKTSMFVVFGVCFCPPVHKIFPMLNREQKCSTINDNSSNVLNVARIKHLQ